jgi:hypothetical protein
MDMTLLGNNIFQSAQTCCCSDPDCRANGCRIVRSKKLCYPPEKYTQEEQDQMKCPHCDHEIPDNDIAKHFAGKGGASTSGTKKESSRENGKKGGRPPNPVKIDIPYSDGGENLIATVLIDKADHGLVNKYGWYIFKAPYTLYAVGRPVEGADKTSTQMQRLIMGNPSGMVVHHKNGNGLDNRKSNLSVLTGSEHKIEHIKIKKQSKGK